MAAEIAIRDMRTEEGFALLETIYRTILEPAFDPAELDPLEVMREGLSEGGSYEAWGLCAVDESGPVSCILSYPFDRSRVLLIGYLATRADRRSLGIGARLIEEAKRRWYIPERITLVVAEVEDPRYFATGKIDPVRRLAFYASQRTEFVVGPYFQPRVREDTGRVYNMLLVVLHAEPEALTQPGRAVRTDQLLDFFDEYFKGSEGTDQALNDDEGKWLVNWYKERRFVELRPIADYAQFELPQPPKPALSSE